MCDVKQTFWSSIKGFHICQLHVVICIPSNTFFGAFSGKSEPFQVSFKSNYVMCCRMLLERTFYFWFYIALSSTGNWKMCFLRSTLLQPSNFIINSEATCTYQLWNYSSVCVYIYSLHFRQILDWLRLTYYIMMWKPVLLSNAFTPGVMTGFFRDTPILLLEKRFSQLFQNP
jgi:hypothetical protein